MLTEAMMSSISILWGEDEALEDSEIDNRGGKELSRKGLRMRRGRWLQQETRIYRVMTILLPENRRRGRCFKEEKYAFAFSA